MKKLMFLSAVLSFAILATAQQDFSECSNAYLVCSNDPVPVKYLSSNIALPELPDTKCIKSDFPTTNSMWFKWEISSDGNLGFLLLPLDGKDDLDFVLYKMNNGLDDCGSKEVIRCMASGENRGISKGGTTQYCSGVTGLASTSTDQHESAGCNTSDDNFLAELQVQKGEVYSLFVNNYYSSSGFILEFTGTASFAPIAKPCQKESNDGSGTVALNGVQDADLFVDPIYPNPARNEITLSIYTEKTYNNGELQIVSLHGDIMDRNSLSIVPGANNINIKIDALPTGVYFLKMVFDENIHITRFSKF